MELLYTALSLRFDVKKISFFQIFISLLCIRGRLPGNSNGVKNLSTDNGKVEVIVGIIGLRYRINTLVLSEWGRHMGCFVRPCERRKEYAKEMLRLNLINSSEIGIDSVCGYGGIVFCWIIK